MHWESLHISAISFVKNTMKSGNLGVQILIERWGKNLSRYVASFSRPRKSLLIQTFCAHRLASGSKK